MHLKPFGILDFDSFPFIKAILRDYIDDDDHEHGTFVPIGATCPPMSKWRILLCSHTMLLIKRRRLVLLAGVSDNRKCPRQCPEVENFTEKNIFAHPFLG